jgi:hypothetical protein
MASVIPFKNGIGNEDPTPLIFADSADHCEPSGDENISYDPGLF